MNTEKIETKFKEFKGKIKATYDKFAKGKTQEIKEEVDETTEEAKKKYEDIKNKFN